MKTKKVAEQAGYTITLSLILVGSILIGMGIYDVVKYSSNLVLGFCLLVGGVVFGFVMLFLFREDI